MNADDDESILHLLDKNAEAYFLLARSKETILKN